MKMTATLTGEHPPGWTGKTGRVDAAMLSPVLAETAATGHFYLCGPNPFMDAIRGILDQAGVDKKRIHQERFD
jgi:ferredoxin-NADP reductase